MPRIRSIASVALLLLIGCGVRPITGGTTGLLRAGGEALSDIQVTVHQGAGGFALELGHAVTTFDGTFAFVTKGAQGPLYLEPGEYCCTLQSAGAPLAIPPEYAQIESTPLKFTWTGTESSLKLDAPQP